MSEERKVEPVLSREEWAAAIKYEADEFVARAGPMAWLEPKEVGALALRGYFTWDMVDFLRANRDLVDSHDDFGFREMQDAIADAIQRILPPRDMETSE